MKFNKKLFPIKAHFFMMMAGDASICPFLPVILKDLGFSSISVGWIFTAYPLIVIFVKPICGTIADKYRCHRIIFFVLLVTQIITGFGTQWLPHMPFNTTAEVICDKNLSLRICSEKLNDSLIENVKYIDKIGESVNNTITCKVDTENWKKYTGTKNQFDDEDTFITFGPYYYFKSWLCVFLLCEFMRASCMYENCLVAELSHFFDPSIKTMEQCKNKTSILMDVYCENEYIMELIKKNSIDGDIETGNSAFWIAFSLIITFSVVGSIASSFSDVFCFNLLGDKPQNYGAQRMWGAVSWGIFSVISGMVLDTVSRGKPNKNFIPSYYMFLGLHCLDLIIAFNIEAKFTKQSKNMMSDISKLFKDFRVILFLFWCFLGGIYCAIIWIYLFWFVEDLAANSPGFDKSWLGTLEGLILTVQCCLGELPFFFASGWIIKKVGAAKSMVIVLLCIAIRFLFYSSLTNPWWILPIEALNGVTFGLFYAVMVTYASSIAPPGTEMTMQNVVGALFEGGGISIGSLLGGYMFKKIGSSKTLLIYGISALVFTLIFLIFQSKLETAMEKTEIPDEKDKKINKEELEILAASS